MKINIGDIFQFPNGKYQWKVIVPYINDSNDSDFCLVGMYYCLEKFFEGINLNEYIYISQDSPFFDQKNKRYDFETGDWIF